MGVAASILIGIGVYELIEHRHDIKARCTHHATDTIDSRDSVVVPSEKVREKASKMSRIPLRRKSDKQATRRPEDATPLKSEAISRKTRRKSLIPRRRRPDKNAKLEEVESERSKEGSCVVGWKDAEGAPVFGPPPPYTPPVTDGVVGGTVDG